MERNKIGQLVYEAYKGVIPTEYTNISAEKRDEAVRVEMFKALGLPTDRKATKKEFRRAWRKNKNEAYAIIEDVCIQIIENGDFQKDSFFNQFVEVKNLAQGDTNEFYVEGKNSIDFAEFSGSHWNLRRTRVDVGSTFAVSMKDYGVHVYEYFERVTTGRASMDKLVPLIANALEKKLSLLGYATFGTAIANLPTEFKFNGTYVEADILEKLAHVEAANGVKPILTGTAVALAKLQGKSTIALSNGMMDEMNEKGFLTTWKGYTCMEIAQGHVEGTFDFTMSNNDIYAVTSGDKLVKMCLEGDVEVNETSDGQTNADGSIGQSVRFKAGCAVSYNKMIGKISITN